MDEIIHHIAVFVAGLWQIHVFGEGNTRTTAVFFIKYLRTLGFDVMNDIFAQNAWYFRNALVRANYNDLVNDVHKTTEYLELFLKNLLLGEKNELHNRTMHISGKFKKPSKQNIDKIKQDIENANRTLNVSERTKKNIQMLRDALGNDRIFGRSDVMNILGITASPASALIKNMLEYGVIKPQKGYGKGKYTFTE